MLCWLMVIPSWFPRDLAPAVPGLLLAPNPFGRETGMGLEKAPGALLGFSVLPNADMFELRQIRWRDAVCVLGHCRRFVDQQSYDVLSRAGGCCPGVHSPVTHLHRRWSFLCLFFVLAGFAGLCEYLSPWSVAVTWVRCPENTEQRRTTTNPRPRRAQQTSKQNEEKKTRTEKKGGTPLVLRYIAGTTACKHVRVGEGETQPAGCNQRTGKPTQKETDASKDGTAWPTTQRRKERKGKSKKHARPGRTDGRTDGRTPTPSKDTKKRRQASTTKSTGHAARQPGSQAAGIPCTPARESTLHQSNQTTNERTNPTQPNPTTATLQCCSAPASSAPTLATTTATTNKQPCRQTVREGARAVEPVDGRTDGRSRG